MNGTMRLKKNVQYLFIDFQKAYYSVHRDTLWKCMEKFKMRKKTKLKHVYKRQELLLE